MLQMAQDMLKVFQDRMRSTLHAVADLAESVGVPPTVTSLLQGLERLTGGSNHDHDVAAPTYTPPPPPPPVFRPEPVEQRIEVEDAEKKRTRRRMGARELPEGIRPLAVDDAIDGSTYLSRIIWALGVAELEGTGALRPADMARMIMSRSPISLEPPNVARYIRRSKPTCIVTDHTEGSSSFYKLNAVGKALFEEKFQVK